MHIVVALGDPTVADTVADRRPPPTVLDYPACRPLPVAKGRNLGAAAALRNSLELLTFLDVDCIPGTDLIERYHTAADQDGHRNGLLCGPVTYLASAGPAGYRPVRTADRSASRQTRTGARHGRRHQGYALFWSLSFAIHADTWHRIGGFFEQYRGYGGEDTDFAQCAAALGVPMCWVAGAHAFHQYHPVADPPVEHLDDIVRNTEIFHRRWGSWPMEGWLASFESAGLIYRDAAGRPVRTIT